MEIKRRLAKVFPVVSCDEFRTSKLCLECGREAQFYYHGVTYCNQQDHRRMQNRDVAAAFKIGARYLAGQRGYDLGPWSRGVVRKEDMHPSSVLMDVLTEYQLSVWSFVPEGFGD